MIRETYWRFKSFNRVQFLDKKSKFLLNSNVLFKTKITSRVYLKGEFKCGFPLLPLKQDFPHFSKSIISLGENSKLIIKGRVAIAPGTAIYIGDNGSLTLGNNVTIAHNCLFICNKNSIIGDNSAFSWNITFIDNDLHSFYKPNGKKIKNFGGGFLIGNNVGIQMNVVMPKARKIGNNSIVSANTIIRNNIPENSLVFQNPETIIKNDITTGFKKY